MQCRQHEAEDGLRMALETERDTLTRFRNGITASSDEGRKLVRQIDDAKAEMLHTNRTDFPLKLFERMQSLVASCTAFQSRATASIMSAEASADKARARTRDVLKTHLETTLQAKRDLEVQIKESHDEIAAARKHLAKLEFELSQFGDKIEFGKVYSEGGGLNKTVRGIHSQELARVRSLVRAGQYTGTGERSLESIFRKFDKDGSGQLDFDEVRAAFRRALKIPPSVLSDPDLLLLFERIDLDRNGFVSLTEMGAFVNFIDTAEVGSQIKALKNMIEDLSKVAKEMEHNVRCKVADWKNADKCRLLVASPKVHHAEALLSEESPRTTESSPRSPSSATPK